MAGPTFTSLRLSASHTVTWIHIGDTHLTKPGEQNSLDLGRIVDEINAVYADAGVDFVFVPGDIADDGSVVAYEAFRQHVDRLQLPWCAVVGDHDVHEGSFSNFRRYIADDLYGGFSIGPYRFLRLNAFSTPKPDAFNVDEEQIAWLEAELQACERLGHKAVLLLHCYPSDLKRGGDRIAAMLQRYPVVLVDMGHTHYNEISNDGRVLYTAARSTGQIEEGPVGYAVTTLSDKAFSWHFVRLGEPVLVAITEPCDERLLTTQTPQELEAGKLRVKARVWSPAPVVSVRALLNDRESEMRTEDGLLWQGDVETSSLQNGTYELKVLAQIEGAQSERSDTVRFVIGPKPTRTFHPIDQNNALGEWEERGLLGTQLGPNKNGRQW